MKLVDMEVGTKAFFIPSLLNSPFKPVIDVHFYPPYMVRRWERYRKEKLVQLLQCTPSERQGFDHGFN